MKKWIYPVMISGVIGIVAFTQGSLTYAIIKDYQNKKNQIKIEMQNLRYQNDSLKTVIDSLQTHMENSYKR